MAIDIGSLKSTDPTSPNFRLKLGTSVGAGRALAVAGFIRVDAKLVKMNARARDRDSAVSLFSFLVSLFGVLPISFFTMVLVDFLLDVS